MSDLDGSNYDYEDEEVHDETSRLGFDETAKAAPKEEKLAKTEDQAVTWLRVLVVLVLVGAALAVSISVYLYLHGEEQAAFESQFESDAGKLLDYIGSTLENTLGPADALIVNLLAHVRATNQSFPFVTMPSYGLQMTKMLRISKAFSVSLSWVVEPDQIEAWKVYAEYMNGPMTQEAMRIMAGDPDWEGLIYKPASNCYDLFTWGNPNMTIVTEPNPKYGYYMPKWHEFPVVSGSRPNGGKYEHHKPCHAFLHLH
jgi:hypothetical protein